MPHVCGDEPYDKDTEAYKAQGCPTYVGMNREYRKGPVSTHRMPHVGGDEPRCKEAREQAAKYAPRRWG